MSVCLTNVSFQMLTLQDSQYSFRAMLLLLIIFWSSLSIKLSLEQELEVCYNLTQVVEGDVVQAAINKTLEKIKKICSKSETSVAIVNSTVDSTSDSNNGTGESSSCPVPPPADADETSNPMPKDPIETGLFKITVTLEVEDISSFSELTMWWLPGETFLNQYVNRLVKRGYNQSVIDSDSVIIRQPFLNLLWTPDTYIKNAKSIEPRSQVGENKFGRLNKKEFKAIINERYYAIIPCAMNFQSYPADTQNCSIKLGPFAEKGIVLYLSDVRTNKQLALLEHEFTIGKSERERMKSLAIEDVLFPPYFEGADLIDIEVIFRRRIINKLAGVYTPTTLVVLVSFTTFWFGPRSTSERVTVGMTALLAIVTAFAQVRKELPAVSYITDMDKWMLACMLYVSAQLIECTIVHYAYERNKLKSETREKAERVAIVFKNKLLQREERLLQKPDLLSKYRITMETSSGKESLLKDSAEQLSGKRWLNERKEVKASYFPPENSVTNGFGKGKEAMKKSEKKMAISAKKGGSNYFTKTMKRLFQVPVGKSSPEFVALKVDAYSRVAFPTSFLICTTYYWVELLWPFCSH